MQTTSTKFDFVSLIAIAAQLVACGGSGELNTQQTTQADVSVKVIVAIGDSETAGAVSTQTGFINIPEASYPARLQGMLGSKAKVHNLGINSSNLFEVYADQVSKAKALNPNILIVSTTLNDAGDRLEKDALIKMYQQIKFEMPAARIILLTPLREGADVQNIADYKANLYRSGLEVFDVAQYQTPDWYCGNADIHPCEYGYREVARHIFNYLELK